MWSPIAPAHLTLSQITLSQMSLTFTLKVNVNDTPILKPYIL